MTLMRRCPLCNTPSSVSNQYSLYCEGVETWDGAERAAYELFMEIRKRHKEVAARRLFAVWGTPPTQRRKAKIRNLGLLDQYDLVKNARRVARECAEQNKMLPKSQQFGPGSTDAELLERHIHRLRTWRQRHIEKGTWLGPFPEE
jgi:hypothetical protein